MSAIFGIINLDGRPAARSDLEGMAEKLAHRGPDGTGVWLEGPVGLGHQMLLTTPESRHERLPLLNLTGKLAITADARLDNRDELIELLGLAKRPVGLISDSELILASYEKWGEGCVEKLLGDFAFAIWDGRDRKLFCARDHFGVKPFYYYSSPEIFAFATEPKALFCLPGVPRRLCETKVADFLSGSDGPVERTFYKDILRLPAGHSMVITPGKIQSQPYWLLDRTKEIRLKSDAEYAEQFRELFVEAVRCRMRSSFPVGSMLSGGMDSSSITCVARRLLPENGNGRLRTFSAIFDGHTECDETPFIKAVIAQNQLEPYYFHADRVGPLMDLDRVLWHLDEAIPGGNLYLVWSLYKSARQGGVRTILDGFDGDTTVSHGTGYLVELAHAKKWITLMREARGYAGHFKIDPTWKLGLWHIERHGLGPRARKSIRLIRRLKKAALRRITSRIGRSSRVAVPRSVINESFLQRISYKQKQAVGAKSNSRPARTEREFHYRRITWPGMQETLETYDRIAGAFAIEARFPFWDKRLIEYCLALPGEQKLYRGLNRMVLRRAMEEILPAEVQWRGGKTNYSSSFEQGLLTYDRECIEDVIFKNPGILGEYINLNMLREAYREFASRKATGTKILPFWKAVSLALWLQRADLRP
jgi:asparagine synthase (glutamine-hydrolysing)